ncbi:transposase [Streptomyces celluloflavus]|uniref:transposase n=1 Tax=Streptomyces celluloflavus TaxID=58344 RepID=UPI0036815AE9
MHRRSGVVGITPGQRADCTQFMPVLEKIRVPKAGPGRPRKKPDSVTADKAYSNRPCREYLRRRGIRHTILEKTDSQAARLRKGSRGGRPPGFDEERYKKRNTIERAVNRLKQHRAVATRYDKRRYVYSEPPPPQPSPSGSEHDRPDSSYRHWVERNRGKESLRLRARARTRRDIGSDRPPVRSRLSLSPTTTCTNMTEAEAVQTPEPRPTTAADDRLTDALLGWAQAGACS